MQATSASAVRVKMADLRKCSVSAAACVGVGFLEAAMSERKIGIESQAGRILALLQRFQGQWVGLPEILALRPRIACHTRRLSEIRQFWNIEIAKKWDEENSELHVSYRLVGRRNGA